MAEGRSQSLWSHTSHVLALIANVNRDPKRTRPFAADQFNPHAAKRKSRPSVEQLTREILKTSEARQRKAARARPDRPPGPPQPAAPPTG